MTEEELREVQRIEDLNKYWVPRLIVFPIVFLFSLISLISLISTGLLDDINWWIRLVHLVIFLITVSLFSMFPIYLKMIDQTIRDTRYMKELKKR